MSTSSGSNPAVSLQINPSTGSVASASDGLNFPSFAQFLTSASSAPTDGSTAAADLSKVITDFANSIPSSITLNFLTGTNSTGSSVTFNPIPSSTNQFFTNLEHAISNGSIAPLFPASSLG